MAIFNPVTITLNDAHLHLGQKEILRGVSLTSVPGEVVAILGANGAGKTTLLSAMAGLLPLTQGQCSHVDADGQQVSITQIGYILQKPVMLRRSVQGNIDFAMKAASIPQMDSPRLRDELLAMFDLEALATAPAFNLSQGEYQRLAVARVLAMRPGVLMMDEATNSMDQQSSDLLESHILRLAGEGMPVFWVTHSLEQAKRVADRVIRLKDGVIADNKKADAFFNASA